MAAFVSIAGTAPQIHSQSSGPSTPSPSATIPTSASDRHDQYRKWMTEFIGLEHYRDANARLKAPEAGEKRVVFLGDSITEGWRLPDYFPGKPYVNRGVDGETTIQMLIRFRRDVIDLRPAVVVILGGVNDISKTRAAVSVEEIVGNYSSMAELARPHNIRVVFSSVMPISNYTQNPEPFLQRSPTKILELNRWLKEYTSKTGDGYIDYFSAMVDEKGMLKRGLSEDGLHPNDAGYRTMASLAADAIKKSEDASPKRN